MKLDRSQLKPNDLFNYRNDWYQVDHHTQRESDTGVYEYGSSWWVAECRKLNKDFNVDFQNQKSIDILLNYPEEVCDPLLVCKPIKR